MPSASLKSYSSSSASFSSSKSALAPPLELVLGPRPEPKSETEPEPKPEQQEREPERTDAGELLISSTSSSPSRSGVTREDPDTDPFWACPRHRPGSCTGVDCRRARALCAAFCAPKYSDVLSGGSSANASPLPRTVGADAASPREAGDGAGTERPVPWRRMPTLELGLWLGLGLSSPLGLWLWLRRGRGRGRERWLWLDDGRRPPVHCGRMVSPQAPVPVGESSNWN